jgi:hypothetical protein
VLTKYGLDLGQVIDAQKCSLLSYGLEFKPLNTLKRIFHPLPSPICHRNIGQICSYPDTNSNIKIFTYSANGTVKNVTISHWSSNAFLWYICKQVMKFSHNVSTRMLQFQNYRHIPNFEHQVAANDPQVRNDPNNAKTR